MTMTQVLKNKFKNPVKKLTKPPKINWRKSINTLKNAKKTWGMGKTGKGNCSRPEN